MVDPIRPFNQWHNCILFSPAKKWRKEPPIVKTIEIFRPIWKLPQNPRRIFPTIWAPLCTKTNHTQTARPGRLHPDGAVNGCALFSFISMASYVSIWCWFWEMAFVWPQVLHASGSSTLNLSPQHVILFFAIENEVINQVKQWTHNRQNFPHSLNGIEFSKAFDLRCLQGIVRQVQ